MEILFVSLIFASLIAFSSSVGVPVGAKAPSGSLAHPYLALENRMEEIRGANGGGGDNTSAPEGGVKTFLLCP